MPWATPGCPRLPTRFHLDKAEVVGSSPTSPIVEFAGKTGSLYPQVGCGLRPERVPLLRVRRVDPRSLVNDCRRLKPPHRSHGRTAAGRASHVVLAHTDDLIGVVLVAHPVLLCPSATCSRAFRMA